MDSPRSPPGSVRRHVRNISHPTPTRAARGPLEEAIDDPLAESAPSPSAASTSDTPQSVQSTDPPTTSTPLPEPIIGQPRDPAVYMQFLRDPGSYHELFVHDIPKAFLESEHQPPPNASITDLLDGGHFRRAAEKSLRDLLATRNASIEHMLQLLYTRLACLVLISRPDLAAQEAISTLDFLSRNAPGAEDVVPLMPWDLRLLLVRLQSIGAADGGRRGIMALYALSGEVRSNLRQAVQRGDEDAIATWSSRLQDLGLRVCDALVEMGELETATRHLDTLADFDPDDLLYRKALLKIRVGDITGAERFAGKLNDEIKKKGLDALLKVADGDYIAATNSYQTLVNEFPSHELFAQNAAVSLLYTGHIASARDVLEDLSTRLPMFPTLLFNLSTIYELCAERALDRKITLTQRAASKKPSPASGGWERVNFEFKL